MPDGRFRLSPEALTTTGTKLHEESGLVAAFVFLDVLVVTDFGGHQKVRNFERS